MELREYERCLREGTTSAYAKVIQKLIYEYYSYGQALGYIDSTNVNKFTSYIRNLKIVFDHSLGGDAKVDGNIIYINPRRLFRTDVSICDSEKNACEIIFHELSHTMNCFHDDYLLGDNGTLSIFCDKYFALARSKFGMNISKNGNMNNPNNLDLFPFCAVTLLDEAIAQDVAEELMAKKYRYDRRSKIHSEKLFGVNYSTNFNYYGFFQIIAEKFAKTLAGVNSLRELGKLSFHEDLPYKIVSEYIERPDSFNCLYKELCYIGLMLYAFYVNDGHGNSNSFVHDNRFIYDSYYRLLKLLDDGYEDRKVIRTPNLVVDKNNKNIRW